jgi:hypothetical protein
MLDQLPSEVILKISSLLTLKDKLILIRTCQQFFNLISKTNLYSKLNIFDHPRQEEEIIDKFINSRYPGSQVKKLYFNINSISDQLLFQLSTIFPNITSVRTSRYRTGDVMFQHRYTKGPMLQWSNTLQIFDLMYDWPEVLPILKTTTFPRLTDLRLSSPYDFDDKKEGFDVSYFLPVFKNVPSLKELTLGECALDLDLLEEIHASCPLIKSLFIRNAHIIIAKEYALPLTILPADSLLSLSINDVFCFDINGLLLEYITSKYRHLKKLDFQLQSGYDAYFFNKYHRHQVDDDGDDDLIAQGTKNTKKIYSKR